MLKPLVAVLALAAGQVFPAEPPIKMGLWEGNNAIGRPGARTTVPAITTLRMRECVVPSSWTRQFFGQNQTSCKRFHETYAQGHYVTDFVCSTGTGHLDVNFISPESVHALTHMIVTTQGHSATFDTSVDLHFVSSSCGSVQPGHPQILH